MPKKEVKKTQSGTFQDEAKVTVENLHDKVAVNTDVISNLEEKLYLSNRAIEDIYDILHSGPYFFSRDLWERVLAITGYLLLIQAFLFITSFLVVALFTVITS